MMMRKDKLEVKEKKMCNMKNITYIWDKQRRNLVVYSVRKEVRASRAESGCFAVQGLQLELHRSMSNSLNRTIQGHLHGQRTVNTPREKQQ